MFFDTNIMNSKTLGSAWCYANSQKTNPSRAGLKKIGSSLKRWVDHDGTGGRLSLRTSALLINGAARLYNKEVDNLFEDCVRLEQDLLNRNSKLNTTVSHSDSTDEEYSRDSSQCRDSTNSNNISRNSSTSRNSPSNASSPSNARSPSKRNSKNQSTITTKDAKVQTTRSYIANKKEKENIRNKTHIDNNSVAVVYVYDKDTQIPSKIIRGNIRTNI